MTRRHVQVAFQEQFSELPALQPEIGARGMWVLWAGLLVGLVLLTYLPTFFGSFIFADDLNVTTNAALRSWRGLWAIWRLPHNFPQFSPLGYTSFLAEFN